MPNNYCFVLDSKCSRLSPTKENRAWYLIRKKRAELVSKYPMVICLTKEISEKDTNKDEIRCGIDDGDLHVGIALVQKCQTRNKVLFKGTIEQRNDVKKKMDSRRGYRRFRRGEKRYRPVRFNNRKSSCRPGRVAPSIFQKRQATLRVLKGLLKWVNIHSYHLEDVSIDIRAMTDVYRPYSWQYRKSNRLDENIRKAVILRDRGKCMECGKYKCRLEVHHIKPRRLNGSNTLSNMITLCEKCHQKTEGNEEKYMKHYFDLIQGSDNRSLNYASHVMIGKKWLRLEISRLGNLCLTTGGDTANKRIDWGIEKSHSNDAVCITDLKPDSVSIKDWTIKPIRRQSKAKTDNVLGIKHRDYVSYTYKNGKTYIGYVKALYPELNRLSFVANNKECNKVNALKCKLLWRFNKIYWF